MCCFLAPERQVLCFTGWPRSSAPASCPRPMAGGSVGRTGRYKKFVPTPPDFMCVTMCDYGLRDNGCVRDYGTGVVNQ